MPGFLEVDIGTTAVKTDMTGFALNNAHWRQKLMAALPAPLRILLQGASGHDLIKNVDATLLVHNNKLVHLQSGNSVALAESETDSFPTILAKTARSLLQVDAKPDREAPLLLLLPANDFLATTIHLPGITKDNLAAALQIQSNSVVPSYEEPLSLSVNPESAERGEDHIALWITEDRLSQFFSAFEKEGLFLAAVKPRLLQVSSESGSVSIIDSDSECLTLAALEGGVLRQWLMLNKIDLEQEEFQQQWDEILAAEGKDSIAELSSEADYLERSEKITNSNYYFFPEGALRANHRDEKGKRLVVAAAVVVILLFIGAIPFLLQTLEFRSLASTLESQRAMAAEAREDQSIVVNFENEWGSLNDFPEQQIRTAMFTLQNILSPEVLTSLEVSEGLIKIQGTSSDPQAILQKLEMDPMFTEVVFSRATNNSRYYIDLRLSTVNFEGYMVRYFPDA